MCCLRGHVYVKPRRMLDRRNCRTDPLAAILREEQYSSINQINQMLSVLHGSAIPP